MTLLCKLFGHCYVTRINNQHIGDYIEFEIQRNAFCKRCGNIDKEYIKLL